MMKTGKIHVFIASCFPVLKGLFVGVFCGVMVIRA